MTATIHALARTTDRLGIELDDETVQGIVSRADGIACESPIGSIAARVMRLTSMVGQAWSDRSNGDCVIAIIRDGKVITFMFRRSSQPHNPQAYGTDKVRG